MSARPSRGWAIVGALSVTEIVSWGVLYYAFAVFLVPMQRELGFSAAELTGAFSVSLLVAGVAGIAVGRFLDRHSPRALMTAGAVAGPLLVVAWSRVESLWAFYAIWVALGIVMATVLYEPAFTVLAKWFTDDRERTRALTALTLVAGISSFIFLPLGQALIDAHGWRDALVILAVVLAVVTAPLHAVVLRRPPAQPPRDEAREAPSAVVRSPAFWALAAAFFLGSLAAFAMIVQAIPFLLERGHGAGFAAFAVGCMGAAQIPGRFLFGVLSLRLPAVFALIALGIARDRQRRRHRRRAGRHGRARDGQRDGDPRARDGDRRPLRRGRLRRDRRRHGGGHDGGARGRPVRGGGVGVGRRLRGAAVDAGGRRRPGDGVGAAPLRDGSVTRPLLFVAGRGSVGRRTTRSGGSLMDERETAAVRAPNGDGEDRSISDLMRALSEQTTTLVRQEIELAKAEMTAKGKQLGMGVGAFGGAAVLGIFAFGALTACFILALSTLVDGWLAALIVAVVYGVVAGVLALLGKKKTQAGAPPVPERAITSTKEDVEWAKTRAKSARQ